MRQPIGRCPVVRALRCDTGRVPLIDNPAPDGIVRSRWADVVTVVSTTFVTVATYLATLGWNHLQQYVTWKVWVFVVVLALEAAFAGWVGTKRVVTATLTTVVTVMWLVDGQTDPETSGDAPMGLLFVFAGAGLGAAIVSSVAASIRTRYERRTRA
jgi:hypothetical protein